MTTARLVANPEQRDVVAFQSGFDIWDMPLERACSIVRGYLIVMAAKSGDQDRLDAIRIELGYLEPSKEEHIKAMPVEDKVKMAMEMQAMLLASQQPKKENDDG